MSMVGESVAQFMERRRRELASFGRDAEAAAHEVYRRTIRAGENLKLATPSDVVAYGRDLLQGVAPKTAPKGVASPKAQQQKTAQPIGHSGAPAVSGSSNSRGKRSQSWADRSLAARGAGGELARGLGNVVGLASGAVDAAKGLHDGAIFVSRLVDPMDAWKSPPGESAVAQLAGVGRDAADYVMRGVADPQKVVGDIRNKTHQMRVELDPTATPMASTLSGELRRRFDIGRNQGEAAFEVGSLVVGGPGAKAVGKLGAVSKAGRAEKYMAQGFSPEAAAYLAEPYVGMGHHFVPRRMDGIPEGFSESDFNRLRPEGMTRGDFYERHYQVDPLFKGTWFGKKFPGETWGGKRLGLQKYGLPGRIWYGSPGPLKARVGGTAATAGSLIDGFSDAEEAR